MGHLVEAGFFEGLMGADMQFAPGDGSAGLGEHGIGLEGPGAAGATQWG